MFQAIEHFVTGTDNHWIDVTTQRIVMKDKSDNLELRMKAESAEFSSFSDLSECSSTARSII